MSLTIDDLGINDDEKKWIYTVFKNSINEQEIKEMGLDKFIGSSVYLFYVDVICKKLGITEEVLLERLNDLYKRSIDIDNIRMHIVSLIVGIKINKKKIVGVYWPIIQVIMGKKGND